MLPFDGVSLSAAVDGGGVASLGLASSCFAASTSCMAHSMPALSPVWWKSAAASSAACCASSPEPSAMCASDTARRAAPTAWAESSFTATSRASSAAFSAASPERFMRWRLESWMQAAMWASVSAVLCRKSASSAVASTASSMAFCGGRRPVCASLSSAPRRIWLITLRASASARFWFALLQTSRASFATRTASSTAPFSR
mmetsp:Transcript_35663/g.105927  ORF Transcript_35663/g.105927 Transcript_35663/m.105927 type:complete len:201 (-) Transcript_35663:528-1130(-)